MDKIKTEASDIINRLDSVLDQLSNESPSNKNKSDERLIREIEICKISLTLVDKLISKLEDQTNKKDEIPPRTPPPKMVLGC